MLVHNESPELQSSAPREAAKLSAPHPKGRHERSHCPHGIFGEQFKPGGPRMRRLPVPTGVHAAGGHLCGSPPHPPTALPFLQFLPCPPRRLDPLLGAQGAQTAHQLILPPQPPPGGLPGCPRRGSKVHGFPAAKWPLDNSWACAACGMLAGGAGREGLGKCTWALWVCGRSPTAWSLRVIS